MTILLREDVSAWPSFRAERERGKAAAERAQIRLVLVDDDDAFREAFVHEIALFGFDVVDFRSGPAMLQHFDDEADADVIVLDWKLPRLSGFDLLGQLRRRGVTVPVVFLTGNPAEAYEELALDAGALDFVDKMRGPAILAKRLRLIVEAGKRPPEAPDADVWEHGLLTLKPKVCRAYWNNNDVRLTVTEFNIVHLLATRAGQDVTYRTIYDTVHRVGFFAGSGEDGYRTNVRSSVKRIRNKFRAIDTDFAEIENFLGFGYRWRGTIDPTT